MDTGVADSRAILPQLARRSLFAERLSPSSESHRPNFSARSLGNDRMSGSRLQRWIWRILEAEC